MRTRFLNQKMQDEKIEQIAAQYYDPELHYHNFDHIRYVLAAGEEILESCRREGIKIDEEVVYYAILFHDAGFREDHVARGFDSKEAYSAELAVRELTGNGLDSDKVQKVKDAILATHIDAKCVSNEDIAVRAADLSGMADDYRVFKQNTVNLKNELKLMSGKNLTWGEWKDLAAEIIEKFLRQELKLTSDYYNEQGESIFHVNTRNNIQKLMLDPHEEVDD